MYKSSTAGDQYFQVTALSHWLPAYIPCDQKVLFSFSSFEISRFLSGPLGDVEQKDDADSEIDLTESTDPVAFHLRFNQPSADAFTVDQSAVKLLEATEQLKVSKK